MKSSIDYQSAYCEIYKCMRNYIWPMNVIEHLADLEVACYDAFVNKEKMSDCVDKLKSDINSYKYAEIDDVRDAIDNLEDLIDEDEPDYLKLTSVIEETEGYENSETQLQSSRKHKTRAHFRRKV